MPRFSVSDRVSRVSDCLRGKNIAYEAVFVKSDQAALRQGLLIDLIAWLNAQMADQEVKPAELARRAHMNPASLWKILHRRVEPKRKTLARLAKALGVQPPAMRVAESPIVPTGHGAGPGMRQDERSVGRGYRTTGGDLHYTEGGSQVATTQAGERSHGGAGATPVTSSSPETAAPAIGDGEVQTLAQHLVQHWQRIAEAHELTGSTLIPLLLEEAKWFLAHGYTAAFDATNDLIRKIRFIEKNRGKD